MKTHTTIAAFALASGTFVVPASAHPHVFAEARLDVTINSARSVESLRHVWRFDDLFSSTVLLEFDKNSDLILDAAELTEVATTIHGSLAEYNYFQLVMSGGKDVKMVPPAKLTAGFDVDKLTIQFETRPEMPLPLGGGNLSVGVYDPTFYTAIDFVDDASIVVARFPDGCTRDVVRPDPNQAIARNQGTLTDAFFSDPTGTDLSKIFATRLELNCK
ncbi:ABC-type uncharacterized transport system, periplasmic component [Aminobacter sp. MSH1]|nr:ABC-type uncharacterized transport system, periplasmic component [Aminobacter sp. MSH1]